MSVDRNNLPRDASAYAQQLTQLLPRGAIWRFPTDSVFGRLLQALGAEFARVDARALDLIEEADPRTTLELLPDWERVYGLPDTCGGAPDNVAERQIALTQKIQAEGGQDFATYIAIAQRLGYEIECENHRPAVVGNRIGDRLNGEDWAHAWTVHVQPGDTDSTSSITTAVSRIGDRIGVRLRGYGALNLECIIERESPAHSKVLFAYEVEPEPDFWFDFTT